MRKYDELYAAITRYSLKCFCPDRRMSLAWDLRSSLIRRAKNAHADAWMR
jgi:hypothetical protein